MRAPFPILYEDNHLLVVSKPVGVLSQEDFSNRPDILTMAKNYIKERDEKPGNVFMGLVHRLDAQVSGVMVLAKTSKAASRLSDQIRKRTVKKKYLAVVEGVPAPSGVMTDWLRKDGARNLVEVVPEGTPGAKRAELLYQRLGSSMGMSLVEVLLVTGRPHQIRVQLANAGHPLVGDRKYGGRPDGAIALFSWQFELMHPTRKETLTFEAEAPSTFPWNRFAGKGLPVKH